MADTAEDVEVEDLISTAAGRALAWHIYRKHGGRATLQMPTDPAFCYVLTKQLDGQLEVRAWITGTPTD